MFVCLYVCGMCCMCMCNCVCVCVPFTHVHVVRVSIEACPLYCCIVETLERLEVFDCQYLVFGKRYMYGSFVCTLLSYD